MAAYAAPGVGGTRVRVRLPATGQNIVFTFPKYFSTIGGLPAAQVGRSAAHTTALPRAAPKPVPPRTRLLLTRAFLATGDGVAASAVGRRRSSAFRPVSHSERHTAHDAARPVACSTRTHVDDDSGCRSARYELPEPERSRRGRPQCRARRTPRGRSPGTTDFASRPGFPRDPGWGPLRTRPAPDGPPSGARVRRKLNSVRAFAPGRENHVRSAVRARDPPRSPAVRRTVRGVGSPGSRRSDATTASRATARGSTDRPPLRMGGRVVYARRARAASVTAHKR